MRQLFALLVTAVIGLLGFGLIESRSRVPMVDFSFFRSHSFLGANAVAFVISFAMLAVFFSTSSEEAPLARGRRARGVDGGAAVRGRPGARRGCRAEVGRGVPGTRRRGGRGRGSP